MTERPAETAAGGNFDSSGTSRARLETEKEFITAAPVMNTLSLYCGIDQIGKRIQVSREESE